MPTSRRMGPVIYFLLVVISPLFATGTSTAAEPDFVGVLALAVENDVAVELGLTDRQKAALLELIDAREGPGALELALSLQELPPGDREKRLAKYRRESEARGLGFFSEEQRSRLRAIRVKRSGLLSLDDPAIAGQLGLSEQQQTRVSDLLRDHTAKPASADSTSAANRRYALERNLHEVLQPEQKAGWEALARSAREPKGPVAAPSNASDAPRSSAPPNPTPQSTVDEGGDNLPGQMQGPPGQMQGPPGQMQGPPGQMQAPPGQMERTQAEGEGPPKPPGAEVSADDRAADGSEPMRPIPRVAPERPPDVPAKMPPPEEVGPKSKPEVGDAPEASLSFNFHFQPWDQVIEWFAEQAGLSLIADAPPAGTFNYSDDRSYTPAEAIDLLNSVLQLKGYMLIRRDRMLIVVNLEDLEDGIPPNLVSTVSPEELDSRGEYELVSTRFQLEAITTDEAIEEIEKLIGLHGKIVPFSQAGQLLVTETGGRLRTIRAVLERIDEAKGENTEQMKIFDLEFVLADEALGTIRPLLDIADDQNASSDGTLRFAPDGLGSRLIVRGTPSQLEEVGKILEVIDVPGLDMGGESGGIESAPQIEIYSAAPADPETVEKVFQTMLESVLGARVSRDPKTGNLIVLAPLSEHAALRATLDQMRSDADQVEVIELRRVDPELAVLAINKLFGAEGENSPTVDGDASTRQLYVRGSASQVAQIRELLEKMGETDTTGGLADPRSSNVRTLPLSGRSTRLALEQLQAIWPTVRPNRIRVVTPSAVIPTFRTGQPGESSQEADEIERLFRDLLVPSPAGDRPPTPRPPSAPPAPDAPEDPQPQPDGRSAGVSLPARATGRVVFASEMRQLPPGADASAEKRGPLSPTTTPAPEKTPAAASPPARTAAPVKAGEAGKAGEVGELPPIVVAPGPGSVMIASRDIEALNAFEDLLTMLAASTMVGDNDLTIFYLTHARASVAAQLLDQVLGGGTLSEGGGSGGGTLLGDLAGAAFGDAGGMVGSLLGLGGAEGSIATSGAIQITPAEDRLNALVVRANPADTETIRQLLEIIDQPKSPIEVMAQPKARSIPLFNTLAEEVAEIVRQVYQDRMTGSQGRGGQPTPQQLIEAISRARGGRRGGSRSASEEVQKMSLGIDSRTNTLIVYAAEPLSDEVRQFVEQLDAAALGASNETVEIVALSRAKPEAVQKALQALLGEAVQVGSSGRSRSTSSRSSSRPSGPPGSMSDEMRRRIEFFRAMQQRASGGFRPPGGSGRPGGGPPGRPSGSYRGRGR